MMKKKVQRRYPAAKLQLYLDRSRDVATNVPGSSRLKDVDSLIANDHNLKAVTARKTTIASFHNSDGYVTCRKFNDRIDHQS